MTEPSWRSLPFQNQVSMKLEIEKRKTIWTKTQKRLDQQFAFIREIDREKFIGRQTYLSDGRRKENDAEHAWHMAIMTMLLSEYANEPIDVLHTIGMLLIHDLVEIDAGDTYAYDEEERRHRLTGRKSGRPDLWSSSGRTGKDAV